MTLPHPGGLQNLVRARGVPRRGGLRLLVEAGRDLGGAERPDGSLGGGDEDPPLGRDDVDGRSGDPRGRRKRRGGLPGRRFFGDGRAGFEVEGAASVVAFDEERLSRDPHASEGTERGAAVRPDHPSRGRLQRMDLDSVDRPVSGDYVHPPSRRQRAHAHRPGGDDAFVSDHLPRGRAAAEFPEEPPREVERVEPPVVRAHEDPLSVGDGRRTDRPFGEMPPALLARGGVERPEGAVVLASQKDETPGRRRFVGHVAEHAGGVLPGGLALRELPDPLEVQILPRRRSADRRKKEQTCRNSDHRRSRLYIPQARIS